jgi:Cupredoxin-like domain
MYETTHYLSAALHDSIFSGVRTFHRGRVIVGVVLLHLLWLAFVPVARAAELPTFELVIRNARFVPEQLEVPARTKFRLSVKNEGPGVEEFESSDLKKEKIIAAGATAIFIFTPLKPGNYRFFGEFHPDTAQGVIVSK